eukprot:scaffold4809_cov116-Isochrysis_galbana.AAC.1
MFMYHWHAANAESDILVDGRWCFRGYCYGGPCIEPRMKLHPSVKRGQQRGYAQQAQHAPPPPVRASPGQSRKPSPCAARFAARNTGSHSLPLRWVFFPH